MKVGVLGPVVGAVIMGPNGAAVRLGIKRTTLYARMRKLGIYRSNKSSLNTA